MPTMRLNGEQVSLPSECTIADFLRDRQLDRSPCAVEVNRSLIPRRQHAQHVLREGDIIEVVTLVGGG